MKCPSFSLCHSIKFCQSHWLWLCAKLVCSGWSKHSSRTVSIFSVFLLRALLVWFSSLDLTGPEVTRWSFLPLTAQTFLMDLLVFAGRRWAQWGHHTWKHQDRTRLADLGLCAESSPTSPPPAPCYPRAGFETAMELHLHTAVFWPDWRDILLW